jgi:glycosyltransferase involved in cell wall biosynthesis
MDPYRPRATVLLDARMVGPRPHGIATYVLGLAHALKQTRPDWRPVLLLSPDAPLEVRDAFTHAISPVPFLHPAEPALLPALVSRLRWDVFHATSFACSPLLPGPWVLTLHDAIHLERPADYGWRQAAYYRLVVGPAARSARAVVTVSQDARARLAHHLALRPDTIHVIHNGVDPAFRGVPDGPHDGPVLAISGPKPHKNLATLVHALRHAPGLRLDVAGQPLPGLQDLAVSLGVDRRVRWLGPVSRTTLLACLHAATALAFPSTLEGFGLPPLEAMAAGCPVVVGDIPVLREVARDAALRVAPLDARAWAETLVRVATSPGLRANLARAGRGRAGAFTWEEAARATASLYDRVTSRRGAAPPSSGRH